MTRPSVGCLIPAYNEAARIGAVLAALGRHPLIDRLLVVDDGSTDDSATVARAAGAEVLALSHNLHKRPHPTPRPSPTRSRYSKGPNTR